MGECISCLFNIWLDPVYQKTTMINDCLEIVLLLIFLGRFHTVHQKHLMPYLALCKPSVLLFVIDKSHMAVSISQAPLPSGKDCAKGLAHPFF